MRLTLVLAPALSLAACSTAMPAADDDDAPDGAVPDDPDAAIDRPDAEQADYSRVYGHSGQQLYRIETSPLDVLLIGPFGGAIGAQSITDIAIDKDDRMIGVTLDKIFEIDEETGAATFLADFQGSGNLTSLSFVPVDPTDPDSDEILVTAGDQGDVYQVDPDTGVTSLLGNFGTHDGEQIVSSGDIVSVRGFGTLATVNVTADFADPDYLAWIDTETWEATPVGTTGVGYDRIFGVGFWRGELYGFVDNGSGADSGTLITIDQTTGEGSLVVMQPGLRWYGAGVTTDAPVVE